MTDFDLVRAYRRGSQEAFAQLVRLHSPWIYAAARRRTCDAHLAEDVTQATFIVLARDARKFSPSTPLAPWLFRVMSYAASTALRSEARRRQHEKAAAEMKQTVQQTSETEQIGVVTDELLGLLKSRDREAILLRYYQGKSFVEMARALHIGEDAARKRVDRALDKLRQRFARRGVTVASSAALSTALAITTSAPAHAIALAEPSANAVAIAAHVTRLLTMAKLKLAAGVAACALLVIGGMVAITLPKSQQMATAAPPASTPANIVQVTDAALGGPSMAAGWPIALPGSITSTPSVADLDGDGKLEVIVTCMARAADPRYLHPRPSGAAAVYALAADGTIVRGFPVEVLSAAAHEQLGKGDLYGDAWFSSPSVVRAGGRDKIALTTPFGRGLRVIDGDGRMTSYRTGNQWNPCPIVDIGNDGTLDFLMGNVLMNVNGGPVSTWPASRALTGPIDGFAPCVGDANSDGQVEAYIEFYRGRGIGGFDHTGKRIGDWPRECAMPAWFAPSMGDISGDAKKEIVAAGSDGIYAWTWDGKDAPGTSDGGLLVATDGVNRASPALADLDGDGKAEVIVYHATSQSVRAWHGDGRPVWGDDGVIATVPGPSAGAELTGFGGVSVVDLAGDRTFDLFVGTYWVEFEPKTKGVTVKNMLTTTAETNWVQPSIADLDADGLAEVVIGLRDGRVCVYRTGKAYDAGRADWPTVNGNFQHTGAWGPAAK